MFLTSLTSHRFCPSEHLSYRTWISNLASFQIMTVMESQQRKTQQTVKKIWWLRIQSYHELFSFLRWQCKFHPGYFVHTHNCGSCACHPLACQARRSLNLNTASARVAETFVHSGSQLSTILQHIGWRSQYVWWILETTWISVLWF